MSLHSAWSSLRRVPRLLLEVARRQPVQVVALVVCIEVVYVSLISAGTFGAWPTPMAWHDLQAEAFRKGQLHLLIAPSAQLLAQANPYDLAHVRHWVLDFSLYEGKYYLYWGPLPALLLAGVKGVFQIDRQVGDQYLGFAFISLLLVSGSWLMSNMARRLFPTQPRWFLVCGIAAFAFSNPLPHSLVSGSVYVVAIAGGQAFLWLGLALAFVSFWSGTEATRTRWLWAAAAAWGLTLACRVSLAPAIALLGGVTALLTPSDTKRFWQRAGLRLVQMGTPSAVVLAALLRYNKARFDEFFEFGTSVQLSAWKFRTASDYVPANLYTYLLRPWTLSCEFPFLLQTKTPKQAAVPDWLSAPADYATGSPLVGLLQTSPLTWAAPLALAFVLRQVAAGRPSLSSLLAPGSLRVRVLSWCVMCFAIAGSVTGVAQLGLYVATMRYIADVGPGLVILGVLGSWWAYDRWRTAPRGRLWAALPILLSSATAVSGLLLGAQGYNGDYLKRHNPAVHRYLNDGLSPCPSEHPQSLRTTVRSLNRTTPAKTMRQSSISLTSASCWRTRN